MNFFSILHIILHFALPGCIARLFFRENFRQAWLIMIATMVVDADHLLAEPVYDPNRCSIGFHPLHSAAAIGIYLLMSFVPQSRKIRLAGIGLLIHMAVDWSDCLI
ncbi:MAG: DUF6122 family protein [Desulfococcaceae bacterium]|jgi:hypothetical protein|nr:DUF6122 family protein [Desulfococcaceae bacterium]